MLFKLVHGQDTFELNPGAKAIKEFYDLTPMQFFFVCLVADTDYDNPLRTLPEKSRREKATQIAGYGMEGNRIDKNARSLVAGNVVDVEKAITKYREIQFDEDKADFAAVDRQVHELRQMMAEDHHKLAGGDPKLAYELAEKATKFGTGILALKKTKKEIEALIKSKEPVQMKITTNTAADLVDTPEAEDGDDEPMSTIDRINMKES